MSICFKVAIPHKRHTIYKGLKVFTFFQRSYYIATIIISYLQEVKILLFCLHNLGKKWKSYVSVSMLCLSHGLNRVWFCFLQPSMKNTYINVQAEVGFLLCNLNYGDGLQGMGCVCFFFLIIYRRKVFFNEKIPLKFVWYVSIKFLKN